jgi:hypothetical protein
LFSLFEWKLAISPPPRRFRIPPCGGTRAAPVLLNYRDDRRAIMHRYYIDTGEMGLGVLAGVFVVSFVLFASFTLA